MRIVFVEAGASPKPVGGTRIVYEQANRLVERGHEVTVIHPVKLQPARKLSKALRLWIRYRSWGARGRWKPSRWMRVHPRVRMLWTPDLKPERFPVADVVVGITWNTVPSILDLPADRGRKLFYGQHWDFGYGPDDEIRAAWAGVDGRVVINRAAQEAAKAMGLEAIYVPNGLDPEAFGIDTPLSDRDPLHVAMLYHPASHKGAADALKALALAKQSAPELTAELFGGAEPPELPDWIAYRRGLGDAELRGLYNRASIFISASANEGWGLAPCEAGFCGCAIAVTDNFGHREFAIDGETALVSAVGDVEALAGNIVRLAQDDALRERLNAGLRQKLAEFTWQRSNELFEQALASG
ncbi:MAG: glycosyltransferase family 4 protein [Ignavibacteriales bacterium]